MILEINSTFCESGFLGISNNAWKIPQYENIERGVSALYVILQATSDAILRK